MSEDDDGRSMGSDRSVRGLAHKFGTAAKMARIDMNLAREWLRHRGAVEESLGVAESVAYTNLIEFAARGSLEAAHEIAVHLPDHLALVEPTQRARYISLLRVVVREQPEAMGVVLHALPRLLKELDDESLALYMSKALELHRASRSKAESFLLMESDQGIREASRMQRGVVLRDVRRTLTLYARAHCGENVQVRASEAGAFTDGRHVYLPSRIDRFGDERDFLIYRVLTARNVGFLEFGSLEVELDSLEGEFPSPRPGELELERFFRSFLNPVIARELFGILEGARVEARVRNEYPGIARDMDRLANDWRPETSEREPTNPVARVLSALKNHAETGTAGAPALQSDERAVLEMGTRILRESGGAESGVRDTLEAVQQLCPELESLLSRVDENNLERLGLESMQRSGETSGRSFAELERALNDGSARDSDTANSEELFHRSQFGVSLGGDLRTDRMDTDEREVEQRARSLLEVMRNSGEDLSLSEAREMARREGASYDEMADFIDRTNAPMGPASGGDSDATETERRSRQNPLGLHAEKTKRKFRYPEWDPSIDDYKPNWVTLSEYRLLPGSTEFVEQVNDEYGNLIGRIRKSFEALRPEAISRVRGLLDGENIDLDRAIAERIERRAGGTPSGRIYMRRQRQERDVAVAFLVDMSSSTNEVVNEQTKRVMDVAKEALVLISEAVDAIGDSSAIWGFSGYGRDQVAFYVAKEFDEPLDDKIRERVGRISWKMENRDGAAIRHATKRLSEHRARVRLLILLSDGKPLDCGCDHYQDHYAQEDTRMALHEARRAGIHPFCITVDPRGSQYLAHMYGDGAFTVIDRVDLLPARLPQVYRRLTR